MDISPQAVSGFEDLATKGRQLGQDLIALSGQLLTLVGTDNNRANEIADCINFDFKPKQALSPSEWVIFFYIVGRDLTELAGETAKLLDEFNNSKPNLLSALVLFPRLKELKPHEFTRSLSKEGGSVDFSNPIDYVTTVFLALCLNREDIIAKAVHFRLVNKVTTSLINQHYVELGGEQWVMERTGQDYLGGKTESITEASLLDGAAVRRAEGVLAKLEPLLNAFQKEAIKELKEAKAWDDLTKPKSLDTEIQGDNGEITTLAEMLPASPDLDEAMPQLLEIWERFDPEDARLLTERFINGKSLNEIAIERDWSYDKAQKRIERLVKEVLDKMPD